MATKEKRAGQRLWLPGPFQLAPGAGQNRHPFPEELSGSGSRCAARSTRRYLLPLSRIRSARASVGLAGRTKRYRLSPRVHLRFRGTSTVHYALPPAAAAARPSRGRGTRALSRLYRHVRHIGALPKGDHRSQPQCRCEGRPPPDYSGRSLQPARWFRHSTHDLRRLVPKRNFFRNCRSLGDAHSLRRNPFRVVPETKRGAIR